MCCVVVGLDCDNVLCCCWSGLLGVVTHHSSAAHMRTTLSSFANITQVGFKF